MKWIVKVGQNERAQAARDIFLSVLAISLSAYYYIARLGFDTPLVILVKVVGISLFFINIRPKYFSWVRFSDEILLSFFVLASLSIAFYFFSPPSLFGNCISTVGYLALFFRISEFLLAFRRNYFLLLAPVILSVFAGLYLTSVFYTNFLTPFYADFLHMGGHIDTLFHVSIAQMIKTYGVVSTGVDLLVPIRYHFGSHLIAASFSKLASINVLYFYQIAFPIIFFPLILKSFFGFVEALGEIWPANEHKNWFTFILIGVLGFTGFLYYDGESKISLQSLIGYQFIYTSESYAISIIFLFVCGRALIRVYLNRQSTKLNQHIYLLPLLFFFFCAALCKISTGFLLFCVLNYIFIRCHLFRHRMFLFYWSLLLIGSVVVFFLINDFKDGEGGIYFLQLIREVVVAPLLWFFLLHFFWSIVAILLLLNQMGIRSAKDLWDSFLQKKTLIIEVVVILIVTGLIPGNVLYMFTRDGVYFTEPQSWISLAIVGSIALKGALRISFFVNRAKKLFWILAPICLLANFDHVIEPFINVEAIFAYALVITLLFLPQLSSGLNFTMRLVLLLVVLFPLLEVVVHNNKVIITRHLSSVNWLRGQLPDASDPKVELGKDLDLEYIAEIKNESFGRSTERDIVKMLLLLDSADIDQKRKLVIYSHNRTKFGERFPCQALPFIVPALTGIQQYKGLEPYDRCENWPFALEYFKWHHSSEIEKWNVDDFPEILAGSGFDRLWVIDMHKGSFSGFEIQTSK